MMRPFVVGFTMGNDLRTNGFHLALLQVLLPAVFIQSPIDSPGSTCLPFDSGLALGKKAKVGGTSARLISAAMNSSLCNPCAIGSGSADDQISGQRNQTNRGGRLSLRFKGG